MDVIAVTSIPKSTKARTFKDDRKDAESLLEAVTSPKSKCRSVYIPSEGAEAARELVRAYLDAMTAARRAKQQLSSMLLRHGYVWNERTRTGRLKGAWTRDHLAWIRSIELPEKVGNETLSRYLEYVVDDMERVKVIKSSCVELAESPKYKPYIDALTRLKGVETMVALAFVATVEDFSRFRRGRSVTSYFGLTPGRHDSGDKTGRAARMSKAGDTTVRRLVIEGLSAISTFTTSRKPERKGHEVSGAVEA